MNDQQQLLVDQQDLDVVDLVVDQEPLPPSLDGEALDGAGFDTLSPVAVEANGHVAAEEVGGASSAFADVDSPVAWKIAQTFGPETDGSIQHVYRPTLPDGATIRAAVQRRSEREVDQEFTAVVAEFTRTPAYLEFVRRRDELALHRARVQQINNALDADELDEAQEIATVVVEKARLDQRTPDLERLASEARKQVRNGLALRLVSRHAELKADVGFRQVDLEAAILEALSPLLLAVCLNRERLNRLAEVFKEGLCKRFPLPDNAKAGG